MERLIPVGKLTPKTAREVRSSRLGLGFEKLDRDVFDPAQAYDRVAQLGIKWVRLQSGWQRTEKTPGIYDFRWLDEIVDQLLARDLQPWLCLCYGNGLYDSVAREVFGAVGCPPTRTEEQRLAWDRYVQETVRHFRGRITWYEVWNEPDGDWCWKTGPSGVEYGAFAVRTAKAVKQADGSAKVIGGSACLGTLSFLDDALRQGMGDWVEAVTYHQYSPDETGVAERVSAIRALCRRYRPDMEVIQGESGSQSRSGGNGALKTGAWTPRKQAKQLLRHAVADLGAGVLFSSFFSCVDMIEALRGKTGDLASRLDYGYFGVLGAEFDEQGRAVGSYTPKPSWYALRNLASLLAGEYTVEELPVLWQPEESGRVLGMDCRDRTLQRVGFVRPQGACAMAYWNATELMTTEYESTVTLQYAALPGPLRLIDPMDGTIYRIPEELRREECRGRETLLHLPVRDYPLFLTFGDFPV